MKTIISYYKVLLLAASVLLSNCKSGGEGDPGPTGAPGEPGVAGVAGPAGPNGTTFEQALENGFIKGTIKGTRRDGTAFEEPFEYKIAHGPEGFYQASTTTHELDIFRTNRMDYSDDGNWPYAGMYIKIENKGAANQAINFNWFELYFNKILANRNQFGLKVEANFSSENVYFPISPANNAKYKLMNYGRFTQNENGDFDMTYNGGYNDEATGKHYNFFTDEDGNRIFFGEIPGAYGLHKYEYYITPAGAKVTPSPIWYNVRFNPRVNFPYLTESGIEHAFFTTSSPDNTPSAGLSQLIDVPPDTQSITNFNYNPATGELTFDYVIAIEHYRSSNTSQHPVEIKGSVKASMYNSIAYRRSFEGKKQ